LRDPTVSYRRLPLTAIGISVLLWSAAYVVSGWALETTSPAVLSVGRSAAATVALIRERLTGRTWLGLAFATIGVALVAASGFRVDVGGLLNIVATRFVRALQAGDRWKRS
jgi:drug/metabolite transporter (DMT)-like permease